MSLSHNLAKNKYFGRGGQLFEKESMELTRLALFQAHFENIKELSIRTQFLVPKVFKGQIIKGI